MLLLSTFLVIVASTNAIPLLDAEQKWNKFLKEFNPVYQDLTERQYRKQIFQENLEIIQKHNAEYDLGLHTYRMGVNEFADKTELEISQSLFGLNTHAIRGNIYRRRKEFKSTPDGNVPESIDWRQKGGVTPVKNQGNCGSCWAFSTIGALEGQYFRATNKTISFSAQQLIDCSESNNGCDDGDMFFAYLDLMIMGGVATEESYPYKDEEDGCKFKEDMAVANVTKTFLFSDTEDHLKGYVAVDGPIAAGIQVTSKFTRYRSGVFYDDACSNDTSLLNHGVVIVGYGSENGTDYWLVKNSWGENWGDNGYIKMSRNRDNNCMIASYNLYPEVAPIQHTDHTLE